MAQVYTPPTDYKSGLEEILKEAGTLYQQRKAAGYPTYTGQQIAGFAPEEQAAMRGISGLVGAGQTYFAPAAQLTMGTARQFTPTEAATYMSPYQQAVVDIEKREAARQFAPQMQQIGAQAAGAGGFGGSRQAILQAEALRNQQQLMQDIQTRGSQKAYETAQRAFESQLAREKGAASGLAALGQAAPRQALAELTALAGVGESQRGMTQAGLDIAKQQYERQMNYPYELLGQYQSSLYQMPLTGFQQFQPVTKPSSAQNLAGILGAVGKIGSGFGLFSEGGHVAFRSQGGLSGMAQKLAAGSGIGSKRGYFSDMGDYNQEEEEVDVTPAGQAEAKQKSLIEMLTSFMESQKEGVELARKAQSKKQELAEAKLAKMEKEASPINYISDVLLGYAAADPEGGLGRQLAGAVEYAEEQRPDIEQAKLELEQAVLDGELSVLQAQQAADKLGIELAIDIKELTGVDMTYPSPGEYDTLAKFVTGGSQVARGSDVIKAKNSSQAKGEAIIAANPSKYQNKETQTKLFEMLFQEDLAELIKMPAGVSKTVGGGSPDDDMLSGETAANEDVNKVLG